MGHPRNRENRRHQHRENRFAHLATIGALVHSAISLTENHIKDNGPERPRNVLAFYTQSIEFLSQSEVKGEFRSGS